VSSPSRHTWAPPLAALAAATLSLSCAQLEDPEPWVVNADLEGNGEDVYVAGYVTGCACSDGGFVRRWTGTGWRTELETDYWLRAISTPEPSTVVAAGEGRAVTLRDGVWSESALPVENVFALWGPASDDLFAVGEGVAHFDGAEWSLMSVPITARLRAVWGTASADVFAVGEAGVILHWDGAAWSEQASATPATLNAVWGDAPDDVYAAGGSSGDPFEALLLHFDGDGWSEVDRRAGAVWLGLHGAASDRLVLVGARGTGEDPEALVRAWDGSNLSELDEPRGGFVWDVWTLADGGYFLAGPDNLLNHFRG